MSFAPKQICTLLLLSIISISTFAQTKNNICSKSVDYCEGKITFENGNIYNGEFSFGVPNGKGLIKFKGGSEYLGDFKNGKIEGQGAILLASGDSYIGEWKNGERIIQMLLWPVFFFNFVLAFWIEFFKQNNDTYND